METVISHSLIKSGESGNLNIVNTLQLANLEQFNIYTLFKTYHFPIIFLTFFLLFVGIFLFLSNKKNIPFIILVLISTIPISFLFTKKITGINPVNFSEFLSYKPQYNIVYSKAILFDNKKIILYPDLLPNDLNSSFQEDKSNLISFQSSSVDKIYHNEKTFPDPLSKQELNICSIYLSLNDNNGDLNNNKYISLSWLRENLIYSCETTAINISYFVGLKGIVSNTESSVFNHEYPDNSFIGKQSIIMDNHSHDDDNDEHEH